VGYVPQKLFRYRLHGLNYSGDAATPAKAIRNLVRARNTADAMRRIAMMRDLPQTVVRPLARRVRFHDYLIDLYFGRRRAALAGWLRSLSYMRERGVLTKEAVRFLAIQLLGPERFSRFASRRQVFRDLSVS
jgi:hypothetical protein